jgi:hypothetical protein
MKTDLLPTGQYPDPAFARLTLHLPVPNLLKKQISCPGKKFGQPFNRGTREIRAAAEDIPNGKEKKCI